MKSAASDPAAAPSLWWYAVPWILFAALSALKIAFFATDSAGISSSDELIYFDMARSLASGSLYDSVQYPPVFPASLIPALGAQNVYSAALALMALYSSALVFPVWLIGREALGVRHAATLAVLSCFLPFHYTIPRTAMSESLYFPLLLLAFYLSITGAWRRFVVRDGLIGVLLGVLMLTRYMTIVFIPAFAAAWLIRERLRTGRWMPDRDAWLRLLLVAFLALACILPWSVMQMREGASFMATVGSDVAAGTLPQSPDAVRPNRIGSYSAITLGMWALWVAPMLGLLFAAFARLVRERRGDLLDRLVLVSSASAGLLLIVVARHAVRSLYNWPDPLRIVERYCLSITIAGLLIAYIAAALLPDERSHGRSWNIAIYGVAPAVVLVLAWWVNFAYEFFPPMDLATPDPLRPDMYHVFFMGAWFWPVALGANALIGWLVARRDRGAIIAATASFAIFFVVGGVGYARALAVVPDYRIHGQEVARYVDSKALDSPRVWIAVSPEVFETSVYPERSFRIGMANEISWETGVRALVRPSDDETMLYPFVVIHTEDEYRGSDILAIYEVDDIHFLYAPD